MQTSTDYGPYLANEPSPLHTTTIVDRCTEKLVDDWNKMRTNVSPCTALVTPDAARAHACACIQVPASVVTSMHACWQGAAPGTPACGLGLAGLCKRAMRTRALLDP